MRQSGPEISCCIVLTAIFVLQARAAAASLEKHGFSNTVRSPAALPMPAYQNGNSTNTAELVTDSFLKSACFMMLRAVEQRGACTPQEKQVAHQQLCCNYWMAAFCQSFT